MRVRRVLQGGIKSLFTFKGALRVKFWWIVKELRRRFEEGIFLGQHQTVPPDHGQVHLWFGDGLAVFYQLLTSKLIL